MSSVLRRTAIVSSMVLLAGCGGQSVGDALGLNRRAPDEFQVVQRAPLVVPPGYGLRPPEPGAPRPQDGTPAQRAQAVLLGGSAPAGDVTPGQAAFLSAVGAADPDIRTVIANESEGLAGLDAGRFWFILDFQRRAYARGQGAPLDATAEAQRLREAGVNVRGARIDSQPVAPMGGG